MTHFTLIEKLIVTRSCWSTD